MITTVMLAAAGVAVGSSAIVFDGDYALADAAITGLALGVAWLIAAANAADASGRRLHERFTMGFWHLEPIVLGLNGALLMGAAVYALVNALGSVLAGGHRGLEAWYWRDAVPEGRPSRDWIVRPRL